MTLEEFIGHFGDEMDDMPEGGLKPETVFKDLDEWSSLVALSIISMVDEEYDKQLTPTDIRSSETIKDLWELIEAK
jgi:acyl carrier protein